MRFHIVSLPNTSTTRNYSWSPYTQKVRQFSKMMVELGHETFIYGGPENDAICTEHIPCITQENQHRWFPTRFPNFDPGHPGRVDFIDTVIHELFDRHQPNDVVCLTEGAVQAPILLRLQPRFAIEIGVGYEATCCERRVFESYAWQHYVYAKQSARSSYFLDTVIPNAYNVNDFPLGNHSDDYMLYVGRLDIRKGIEVAIDVAREVGCRLVVAGSGDYPIPDLPFISWIEYVGIEERAFLMGEARCLIAPTLTIEPFGGTVVEAQLCGTPVLTTDWGAFVETVDEGQSGFRCRSLSEFVYGWNNLDDLEYGWEEGEDYHNAIRRHARMKWGTRPVRKQWADYLARVVPTPSDSPPGAPQSATQ